MFVSWVERIIGKVAAWRGGSVADKRTRSENASISIQYLLGMVAIMNRERQWIVAIDEDSDVINFVHYFGDGRYLLKQQRCP